MAIVSFRVQGMDCAEEVTILRAQLDPLPGIQSLGFEVLNAKLTVDYNATLLNESKIAASIAQTGMTAELWVKSGNVSDSSTSAQRLRLWFTVASGILLMAGLSADILSQGWLQVLRGAEQSTFVGIAFSLLAAVAGAWFILPKAWNSLRRFRPDMNLLMVVAMIGAMAIGQFSEAATVAFLFAVSLALESWSVGRARRAIASLMTLAPSLANVLDTEGKETRIEAAKVSIGAVLVVRPGERFPLDGTVVRGETTVNQSPITGESIPVSKSPGSEVFAGTINQDGAIEVRTTKLAEDTKLSKIIRMVGDAQSQRSTSEQWVETFARFYTPAVLCMAIAVVILPPLLLGGLWNTWFYQGLTLLVIACPCALVISTPVSIVAGMATAAKNGVLIKAGSFLEIPARLKAIALDKTGTLTFGTPEVKQVIALANHTENDVLRIAAALESRSQHPLAKAILSECKARDIEVHPADSVQAVQGKGVLATLAGETVWLGSHRWLEEKNLETTEMHLQLNGLAEKGQSVVIVGERDHVCGFIALADKVRPIATIAISALRSLGIEKIVMLSGDNKATAEAIARQVGVNDARGELLPADKVLAIDQLVKEFGLVAMIGDGVNDAPALARASLGIAMGAVGTDAAIETADIALMSDDLEKVPWLIRHSRRTLAIIRQNVIASLSIKLLFMILSLTGHTSLWAAIAADAGMSLVVIANGLRLLVSR